MYKLMKRLLSGEIIEMEHPASSKYLGDFIQYEHLPPNKDGEDNRTDRLLLTEQGKAYVDERRRKSIRFWLNALISLGVLITAILAIVL